MFIVSAMKDILYCFYLTQPTTRRETGFCYSHLHVVVCRLMDHMQQKQISTDPCGPKLHSAFKAAGPGLPQVPIHDPPLVSPSEMRNKQSGLSPVLAAAAPVKVTDQTRSAQAKHGSTPAALASISRPRPTALGTKPAPKPTRVSADPSKEIDLNPVCIPGPQSANVLSHSPTESSLPLHCPQGPHSPQPYLSPNSRFPLHQTNPPLPSSLSPQPQRTPSPGTTTQSQVHTEKTSGDNNDFR